MQQTTRFFRSWRMALGLLALTLCSTLAAQSSTGQIAGRVLNGNTQQNVQSATVRLLGTSISDYTDSTGSYLLTGVEPGSYVLEVSYPGTETSRVDVVVTAGQRTLAPVTLSDVVVLDAFVIEAITEGNALAQARQRASDDLRSVVSTDAYGNVTNGNVGNILRMIPGVTTTDADGDARFAIIRGLSPQLSTMTANGMPIATAQANGAQQLDVLSTNNLKLIEVIKQPTPDMEHDAIGGSINVISRSAFDRRGRSLEFTLGGGYMQMLGKTNSAFAVSFADTFRDKRLGLTLNASNYGSAGGTQGVAQRFRFNRPSDFGYNPNNNIYELDSIRLIDQQFDRTRQSFGSRLDFKVSDELLVFAEVSYNHYDEDRTNRDNQWNIGKNLITAQPYFDDGVKTISVPLTGMPVDTALGGFAFGVVDIGPVSSFIRMTVSDITYKTDLYNVTSGFELKKPNYQLTGRGYYSEIHGKEKWLVPLQIQMEGFQMEANRAPDPYWPELKITGQEVTELAPTLFAPSFVYRDPTVLSNYGTPRNMDTNNQDNSERLFGFKTDYLRLVKIGNKPVALRAGASYRGKRKENNADVERWNYQGGGQLLQTFLDTGFKAEGPIYDHYKGLVQPPWPDIVAYDKHIRQDPAGKVATDPAYVARNSLLNDWRAQEDVAIGYGMATVDLTPKLRMVAGLHYEWTSWETDGFGQRPSLPGEPTFEDEVTEIKNPITGEIINLTGFTFFPQSASDRYDKWSPGLHLKYEVRPNVYLRAAYTDTFSRPEYTWLIPRAALDMINYVISPGNSNLNAVESQNFDLAAEMYFKKVGLFSIGVFRKNVDGFIFNSSKLLGNGASDIEEKRSYGVPENLLNNTWTVNRLLNGQNAKVNGVEVSYLHRLSFLPSPLDGFSVMVNATFIDSEANILERAGEFFPLVDQSDESYSGALSFEKWGFTARLMGTYRGEYLTAIGGKSGEDIYSESRTIWNLSVSQQIRQNWEIYGEALNLSDSPFRQYFGKKGNGHSNFYYGRMFNFGVRARF